MNFKNLGDLSKRIRISSILILLVATLLTFYDYLPITIALVLLVACAAAIAVWEYAKLAVAKKFHPSVKTMIFFAVMEVFAFFAAHKNVVISEFPALVLVVGAITFFIAHFKGTSEALANIAIEFFGVCYVSVPLSCFLGILYPIAQHEHTQDGRWWFVYLIISTKIVDICGYFVGKLWGKRKLAPVLSPKKTVEGALAGFVGAILVSVAFSGFGKKMAPDSFHLPIFEALALGALIGILAQIGDLAESLLKRDAGVKDSNVLSGPGGALDMLDSLLLTTPIVYFYLKIV
ncbi:MAG: hypothetical protein EBZ47_06530 [Chlamydiae bacterium]|nr:hypothetical protein [Chlamydiota bacterium]